MTGQEFVIDRMRVKDLGRVAELEKENFSEPWAKKDLVQCVNQRRDNSPNCYFANFVAREPEKNQVIGYIGSMVVFDEVNVFTFAVADLYRCKGVGRALLEKLVEFSAEGNATAIFLEVRESNTVARKLYESVGFVETGKRKNFYGKPREDAVSMRKDME